MLARILIAFLTAGLLVGCSSTPRAMPEPVDVSGTVTFADGRPVKDVQLVLRPKGEGHPAYVTLGADGKFTAKVIPGDFMFLFEATSEGKMDRAKAKAALATVPPKYQDVSVDHTVPLSSAGPNQIKLN